MTTFCLGLFSRWKTQRLNYHLLCLGPFCRFRCIITHLHNAEVKRPCGGGWASPSFVKSKHSPTEGAGGQRGLAFSGGRNKWAEMNGDMFRPASAAEGRARMQNMTGFFLCGFFFQSPPAAFDR